MIRKKKKYKNIVLLSFYSPSHRLNIKMVQWYGLLALTIIPATCANTWIVGQAVNTTSGIYTGHASKARPEVSEYLGMRYGQRPLANVDFQSPSDSPQQKKL